MESHCHFPPSTSTPLSSISLHIDYHEHYRNKNFSKLAINLHTLIPLNWQLIYTCRIFSNRGRPLLVITPLIVVAPYKYQYLDLQE